MGPATFLEQLRGLGYEPTVMQMPDIVAFPYEIEVGPLVGETITLAFKVPADFPMTPPSGPLVSPPLLPLNNGGAHPHGAIHPASTGGLNDPNGTWQYWSRPFPGWPQTSRDVAAYLAHIRRLLDTLPDDLQRRPDH